MQAELFCKMKHPLLSSSNMGNILLLIKNYFPFSIDFRTSSYISTWSSFNQKECRESLGRRKAALLLYCQSCVVPEWRWMYLCRAVLLALCPCLLSAAASVLSLGCWQGAELRWERGKWTPQSDSSWNVSGESEAGVRRWTSLNLLYLLQEES